MRYGALLVRYEEARNALAELQAPTFGLPTVMVGSTFSWKDAVGLPWSGVIEHADTDRESGSAVIYVRNVKRRERQIATRLEALRDGLDIAAESERFYAVFPLISAERVAFALPQRMRLATPEDFSIADVIFGDEKLLVFSSEPWTL